MCPEKYPTNMNTPIYNRLIVLAGRVFANGP